MRFSEVCVLTGGVRKLADFYKRVLEIDNGSDDDSRQVLIDGDVRLVFWNDDKLKTNNNTNMSLVFVCDNVDEEYERLNSLKGLRLHFVDRPHDSIDGYRSLCFYDLDGNMVFFKSN